MTEDKLCLGKWDNCPDATTSSFCHKLRKYEIEISCMKIWLDSKGKNN